MTYHEILKRLPKEKRYRWSTSENPRVLVYRHMPDIIATKKGENKLLFVNVKTVHEYDENVAIELASLEAMRRWVRKGHSCAVVARNVNTGKTTAFWYDRKRRPRAWKVFVPEKWEGKLLVAFDGMVVRNFGTIRYSRRTPKGTKTPFVVFEENEIDRCGFDPSRGF